MPHAPCVSWGESRNPTTPPSVLPQEKKLFYLGKMRPEWVDLRDDLCHGKDCMCIRIVPLSHTQGSLGLDGDRPWWMNEYQACRKLA